MGEPRDHDTRRYQFRIRGCVDESMDLGLADMMKMAHGDETLLTAGLLDRVELYTVVEQIEEAGLELLGIRPLLGDEEVSA